MKEESIFGTNTLRYYLFSANMYKLINKMK